MKIQQILSVILIIAFLSACTSSPKQTLRNNAEYKYNIVGHYQFFTTGGNLNCETVKHEFDLDTLNGEGTFLYHVFCLPYNGDSTGVSSALTPFSMIGKWTFTSDSSVIMLTAANGKIIKLRIENNKITDAFNDKNKELMGTIFFYSSE